MTARVTITWNASRSPETTVTVSDQFKALLPIERADCLQDAMADLEALYDEALADMRAPIKAVK
jgi:hypothetical protein